MTGPSRRRADTGFRAAQSRPGNAAVRGSVGGELTTQGAQLLKTRRRITHYCSDADHLPGIVGKWHDSELHRDACAILSYSRDGQHLAVSVTRLPSAHRSAVSLPVPLAQALRNDNVKRAAEGFSLREAENSRRAAVP